MSAQQTYTIFRGGIPDPMKLPLWQDLPDYMRAAFEAVYGGGIHAASEYVDGNWSNAHDMAEHLRLVGNGEREMYQSE